MIDFPNTAFHKLSFISKYRDNSLLRNEVVRSSYEKSVSHNRFPSSTHRNTDSQHLLAEQQVAAMYPHSNPARASAKGLQSFVLSVIRMMARFSTLEQLRQTMAALTVIRLIRVRKHL